MTTIPTKRSGARSPNLWAVALFLLGASDPGQNSSFCSAFQHEQPYVSFGVPHGSSVSSRSPTQLFIATGPPSSQQRTDTGTTYQSQNEDFLEDGKGHINPELAQRIFKWEREQRLNLEVRSSFSTREGLRWVQDLVFRSTGDGSSSRPSATLGKEVPGSTDDLIQEGVIALMQAMTTYEQEARPTETFEVFAKSRIQRSLEDYLVNGKLAASTNSRKTALSVESTVEIADPLETHYSNQDEWEVREGLLLDNGKKMKREELVEDFLDETLQYEGEDQMWVQQQQIAAPLRDSIPATEDDDSSFEILGSSGVDDLSLDDLALRDMILYDVDQFLDSTLNELEAEIIQLRFGLDADTPKTQKEVAYELNLTISKVRRIQKIALEKLRHAFAKQYVDDEDDFYHEDTV